MKTLLDQVKEAIVREFNNWAEDNLHKNLPKHSTAEHMRQAPQEAAMYRELVVGGIQEADRFTEILTILNHASRTYNLPEAAHFLDKAIGKPQLILDTTATETESRKLLIC